MPGIRRALAVTGVMLLLPAPAAGGDDAERLAMRRVRLTTEPAATSHCARIGAVSDDSVKDLRRKIVKAGGDTALLTFGLEDMEKIHAQIFRCPTVPPPPPGPPPPRSPPPPR